MTQIKSKVTPAVQHNKKSKLLRNDNNLSVLVYSLAGKETGTIELPKVVFGGRVKKSLLSQAVRVYSANLQQQLGSTKTRGQVHGTTAKMYRQKGTGRARHGAQTAPIFVGGGIAFGPKPRTVKLNLSKRMKKSATLAALADKLHDQAIIGVSGLEKSTGKTKELVGFLNKTTAGKGALIITADKIDNVTKAAANIPNVAVLSANLINAYDVIKHRVLVVTKEAVEKLSTQGEK